jgi:hypothetical protein
MGTVEYLGYQYVGIWNLLVDVEGLEFACLGAEEGVELENKNMTVGTFPWADPFLVVGAFRGPDRWAIRSGPALARESGSMGWSLDIFRPINP